jgi:hypothetical protein
MTYFTLKIVAASTATNIWLGDLDGCLVKKSVGVMELGLMPGNYVVQFELGTNCYPVFLDADRETTQSELMAGHIVKLRFFAFEHASSDSLKYRLHAC